MDIMGDIGRRPWPLPSKNWIMRQRWRNLLFSHWPIPPEILRRHIPSALEIDTYQGYAYLGVIVFVIEGIHPRGLSSISLTPVFPEVNLRTYVHYQGKPGVFFLSLDVEDWASYTIARRWYRLPYKKASILFQKDGETCICQSVRKGTIDPSISFGVKYEPTSELYFPKEGTLDYWLTERYCLFSTNNGSNIYSGEIHHQPWPLQKAEAEISKNTLFTPFKMEGVEGKPIYHFSKGLDTLFWNIKKM
ncbi:YqjF family protein [Niallia endozanthoxylica]|uniref:DUF2071 domain-containing protein n=1 Tax=Niallia endozanthoxylica TaxID=2036016 RepID=A0A5J5I4X5_9BACI|nr:DUF2071 domain-containing protein [Niallia endozanthoxylica]KAA9031579.1 DUF2071 domain-containing protein [Niallia endozanthoxylica]